MSAQPVVLREYEAVDVRLEHRHVAELRRIGKRALSVSPTDEPDVWQLRAGSIVGSIVTSAARVLIRPKVHGANLFHMLEADGTSLDTGREVFEYERSHDLIPAFATLFVRHLERALGQGLRRQYVATSEQLQGIRGRVDLRLQTSNGGLPLPVWCDFDEHTPDTHLNRVVLAAVVRLARMPGVAVDTRRSLYRAASMFEGVGHCTPADLMVPTRFTRLDEHFRGSEHLARLVLEGSSVTDEHGTAGAASFVVDMNVVFERFVEARLRRRLRDRLQVLGQFQTQLDVTGDVRMRPDLLFRRQGRPVYIGDAKYKISADGLGRESDYYQLLAYCTALELPEGMLIYCQHEGNTPRRDIEVRGASGTRLLSVAVALDGSPAEIDQRLDGVADLVWDRSMSSAQRRVAGRRAG